MGGKNHNVKYAVVLVFANMDDSIAHVFHVVVSAHVRMGGENTAVKTVTVTNIHVITAK
tara:strand:+ start:625 stop:801 length:177 start_codon:yes stop_codon:yes gene_type:complete